MPSCLWLQTLGGSVLICTRRRNIEGRMILRLLHHWRRHCRAGDGDEYCRAAAGRLAGCAREGTSLGQHQTGHNSGVIHSGIYYAPGSLKADLCRRGAESTKNFCRQHGIPFETCGKLLVATNSVEKQRMDALFERSIKNGIKVERLDAAELRRREPEIVGVGALFVESTGIVDYRRVANAMADVIRKQGGTIELDAAVTSIHESATEVAIASGAAAVHGESA